MTTRVSNPLATLFPACLASICMVAVAYGNPNYRLLHTCNNNKNYKNYYKNHNYNNYNVLLFIEKIIILDYENKKQGTYIVIFKWQQVSQKSLKHFIPLFETEHTFTPQQ